MSRHRPYREKKIIKYILLPTEKAVTFDIRYMTPDMQRSVRGPEDFYCHSMKLPLTYLERKFIT
jgi:hypothetical protein